MLLTSNWRQLNWIYLTYRSWFFPLTCSTLPKTLTRMRSADSFWHPPVDPPLHVPVKIFSTSFTLVFFKVSNFFFFVSVAAAVFFFNVYRYWLRWPRHEDNRRIPRVTGDTSIDQCSRLVYIVQNIIKNIIIETRENAAKWTRNSETTTNPTSPLWTWPRCWWKTSAGGRWTEKMRTTTTWNGRVWRRLALKVRPRRRRLPRPGTPRPRPRRTCRTGGSLSAL